MFGFICCLVLVILVSCKEKDIKTEQKNVPKNDEQSTVFDTNNKMNKEDLNSDGNNKKIKMSNNEYYSTYIGYLDKVDLFGTTYENCDYDGDGIQDRIYRDIIDKDSNGAATKINYRIDFGNGTQLVIGDFDDIFTGIQIKGYDLTGDHINEIIFCGEHVASTFPESGSEVAVFEKGKSGYSMIELPRPDLRKEEEIYRVGYSIYIKDINNGNVTIYNKDLNFETLISIDDKNTLARFAEVRKDEPIGSDVWKVDTFELEGKPGLIFYINLGSTYYNKELQVFLSYQDGKLKPVDAMIEN